MKHTAQTNAEGVYSFLALPAATYRVDVQQTGFKDFRQVNIVLNANAVLRLDITLQLGGVTDVVEVSASAVHVETSSTQLGDVIDAKTMTTQPLNGRSYIDLLGLQPGVVPVNSTNASGGVSGNLAAGNVSVGGQRENANGFMVNGASVEEQRRNGTSVIPNLDSIAEFRLLTNVFDAEYGHYGGGLINVITKSGANQFRGSAFEFWRDQRLDANYYFNNTNNVPEGRLQAQPGRRHVRRAARARQDLLLRRLPGDPRETIGTPQTTIVPSEAQRAGDLSDLAGDLTDKVKGAAWAQTLATRLGYPVSAGEPYYFAGCTTTAACVFPERAHSDARIRGAGIAAPEATCRRQRYARRTTVVLDVGIQQRRARRQVEHARRCEHALRPALRLLLLR